MRKLMSANLFRLWRDKVFWLCVLGTLILSAVVMLGNFRYAARDISLYHHTLEHYYYELLPFSGLIIPVFTSLFVGTEYSDGTLRNKLMVGHRRTHVYLANLATCTIASLAILAALYLGGMVGIPVFGAWPMGLSMLVTYMGVSILTTVALSAIFTLVGMLTPNKAISVVLSFLLALGLILLSSQIYNALQEPEMISGMIITMENGMQMGDPQPNPCYISGAKRSVYQFLSDFLPASQAIQIADLSVAHPVRMMLCSFYIILGTTLYGAFIFQRKDIK